MIDDTLSATAQSLREAVPRGVTVGPPSGDLVALTLLTVTPERQIRTSTLPVRGPDGRISPPPEAWRLAVLISAPHRHTDELGAALTHLQRNTLLAEDRAPVGVARAQAVLQELPLPELAALWRALEAPLRPAALLEIIVVGERAG